MTTFRIQKLHALVGGLKETTLVRDLVRDLEAKMKASGKPFEGAPMPVGLIADRLPPGILSAWVFVLRPRTPTPAHQHPNSIQHMAVIQGGGLGLIGTKQFVLQPYDPAFPERSVYVIPAGTAHAFEAGNEILAVMSFHTVSAEDLVEVEVDIARGIPCFSIVGLPNTAVRESRERVTAALKNSGWEFPLERITVNLAPADIKKDGTGFDLPIALGILAATVQHDNHWQAFCRAIALRQIQQVRPPSGGQLHQREAAPECRMTALVQLALGFARRTAEP
jgi:quercetin dioxygenase-like cupin family protein